MASQFDSLFADAVEVSAAMWAPEQTGERQVSEQAQRVVFEGTLQVAADLEVDKRDSWIIDGWRYQCDAIGHIHGGLRAIKLRRVDRLTTTQTPNLR